MEPHVPKLATRVSRAMLSAGAWTPSLEQNLHRLGFRQTLNPSLVSQVIDPHLLTHHSLALGFFNWASQQPGFAHNSESYKSVLKCLSFSRQYGAIHSLLKQVRTQKIGLHLSVYRSVIDSLIVGKKTHDAFLVFNEVTSITNTIGSEPCNSLLAALASDGFFEHAQKVFDEMSIKCIPFDTLGFGVFIWRVCRNADIVKVLTMLDDARTNNREINGSIIATLIIHGLCGASRVSEASNVVDELKNRDCKPDFLAYWIIAEAFQSAGSVAEREKILKKKRKLGVAPRLNDYKEFLFALIAGRRICEAKELGEVIIRGNFPLDEDVSNVLIGSVAAIDPHCAIMFFKFMVEKERFPTLLTLRNLSRNLCKHGKIDELLEVFQVLGMHNYFNDFDRYHLRTSFLCKAGMVKEAYGVLQEMKKKGFALDVSFYNCVLEACCREDLLRPARKLWDEMFASGCGGNLKTYNILIQKFSKSNQIAEALTLYHHMLGKKVEPDITTYTSLLQGLCQESQLEAAFEVFSKSVEQDANLAGTLLNTFILCLCRADPPVTAIVDLISNLSSISLHLLTKSLTLQAISLMHPSHLCYLETHFELSPPWLTLDRPSLPNPRFSIDQIALFLDHLLHYPSWLNNSFKLAVSKSDIFASSSCLESVWYSFLSFFNTNFMHMELYITGVPNNAGHFLAASKLLRGLTNDIAHPDSHVILLKGFADAGEIQLAKQHIEWVRETSPSKLSVISTELLTFLPSSSRADPILQILQTIQELSHFSYDE